MKPLHQVERLARATRRCVPISPLGVVDSVGAGSRTVFESYFGQTAVVRFTPSSAGCVSWCGSRSRDAIPGRGASQVQRAGVGGAARTGRTGEGRGVERPVDNGWARAASPFQAGTKVVIARFVSHRAGWKGLGARGAALSRAPISFL